MADEISAGSGKSKVANPILVPRSTGRLDFIDLLVFLIPFLRFVEFRVVGVLSGADISLLAVFVYLLLKSKIRIMTQSGRIFVILCTGWLISQCVTDVIRHTAFADYSRGWSNIGMTLTNFIVLFTLLYLHPKRIAFFGWGLVLGSVLTYFISPTEQAVDYPWKFGLADSVNWAVLLLASRKSGNPLWQIALITVMGLVNIVAGTRNQGGVCLTVVLYLIATRFMRKRNNGESEISPKLMLGIASSIVLSAVAIVWVYQYAAGSGMLGEDARSKYEQQASGKYGFLLGGRTEILGSIPAIYDSPIIGHGSWARDPAYLLAERQALALMGYSTADEISLDDLQEGLIPAHSYIFGAWVNAGIVGAIFWGWVFFLTVKSLIRIYPESVVLLPLGCFCAFSLLWELLFSPYGAQWRIITPYYIVTLMSCVGAVAKKPGSIVLRQSANKVVKVSAF